jgi:DNA-binding NarL/FixJ family response regulator
VSSGATRLRVLLGNLEPMTRLGMRGVLADGGVEVVADVPNEGHAGAILAEARRVQPDAVVLGLDAGSGRELGERVRAVVPDTMVILWSRDETEMEVFEPGSAAPRRVESGVRDALLSELRALQANRERE